MLHLPIQGGCLFHVLRYEIYEQQIFMLQKVEMLSTFSNMTL